MNVCEYLSGGVNFPVPESAIEVLCKKRGIDHCADYYLADALTLRLLHADVLKWIVRGASRVGAVRDSDNSWSHSDGGYTLTKDDKKLFIDEANGIYDELEPESKFGQKGIRMRSAGIMRASTDACGFPLPRKPL